jgi:hypothetical protein
MKQQQKMSVWPYLSFVPSWGENYLIINLTNKGIGPALIKNVNLNYAINKLDGLQHTMHYVPDSLKCSHSYSSIWAGQVIMAGETIEVFKIIQPKTVSYLLNIFMNEKIEMEVCYASVYGDTWINYGFGVKEGGCDQ